LELSDTSLDANEFIANIQTEDQWEKEEEEGDQWNTWYSSIHVSECFEWWGKDSEFFRLVSTFHMSCGIVPL
jgi:hypothetical protein